MKRSFVGLHHSRAVDEEARTRLKHQTLLEEYLQLQKEFVSMKRKLKTVMKRRDTLVAEVRFLARRRQYLLKTQSLNLKLEDHPQPQNSDTPSKILEKNRKGIIKAAALGHPYLGLVSSQVQI
ncbi:uncharacterized protein LOC127800027 isoform X2 [Diospyros lotus]|nr:uncharacterized protein LOC127800027 isoform X2 [Diospyros lotus]